MQDERLPRSFGPYVLFEVLGAGGAGAVYAARSREASISGPVVVKVLHPAIASNELQLNRFRQEAELAGRIDHPNVIKVFDAGTISEQPYLAMEYVIGWTAREVISAVLTSKRGLPTPIAVGIIRQALQGLSAIHALDLVHRDLSPNNVMIDEHGIVRLIDLGLAKSYVRDWRTATGTTMGSPGYMPPEQIVGDEVRPRADFYPLGVLLFELLAAERMISGSTAFAMLHAALQHRHRPVTNLRSDVPVSIDETIRVATHFEADSRFSSCAAFIAALDRACPSYAQPEEIERCLTELVAERREERTRLVQRSRTVVMEPAPAHAAPAHPASIRSIPMPLPQRASWLAPAGVGLSVGIAIGVGAMFALKPPELAPTAPAIAERAPATPLPVAAPVVAIERRVEEKEPARSPKKSAAPVRSPAKIEPPVAAAPPPPPAPTLGERKAELRRRGEAIRSRGGANDELLAALNDLAMINEATLPEIAGERLARIERTIAKYERH